MVVLRRRALFLFVACLVLLFGGIWSYQAQQADTLQALGETIDVVVAARDLDAWVALTDQDVKVRQVPKLYTGPDRITAPDELIGKMLTVPIPAGAGIPNYTVYPGPELHQGERTWELRQGTNILLDSQISPGDRVDVLAALSSSGSEAIQHVLSGARVVAVQRKEKEFTILLAVTLDQGRVLMEVENFARQVRVVRDPMAWMPGGGQP